MVFIVVVVVPAATAATTAPSRALRIAGSNLELVQPVIRALEALEGGGAGEVKSSYCLFSSAHALFPMQVEGMDG